MKKLWNARVFDVEVQVIVLALLAGIVIGLVL